MLLITFRNDGSGDGDVGNYEVRVSVNGLVIAEERVEGHRRAEGWRALVRMLGQGARPCARTGDRVSHSDSADALGQGFKKVRS